MDEVAKQGKAIKHLEFLRKPAPIRQYATADDIRKVFADYGEVLQWLACFLVGEKLAPACVEDACRIAQRQGPAFQEWLLHWAAQATLHCALESRRDDIAEIAPLYEGFDSAHIKRAPLSPEDVQVLVEAGGLVAARLDVLSRFAFIMHGVANESCEDVAGRLGISPAAVERAYCVAFDTFHLTLLHDAGTSVGRCAP